MKTTRQGQTNRRLRERYHYFWCRIKRYLLVLFQKKSFSEAHSAASTLNILLCFFDELSLECEIKKFAQSFAYLLEPSSLYLEGKPCKYFSSDNTLYESWLYALDNEETRQLLELYQKLRGLIKKPERALHQWMKYLTNMGLEQIDAQQETVKISPEVRKRYDNTIGLADGIDMEIELHPWCLGSNLLVSGMLKR